MVDAIDSQVFVAALITALLTLAVIFFGVSALLHIYDWIKMRRFVRKEAQATRSGEEPGQAPTPKQLLLPMKEGTQLPAFPAPSPQPEALLLKIRQGSRDPKVLEISDVKSRAKTGIIRLAELWEGAAVVSLALSPDDTHASLRLRPLRTRKEGALCSVIDSGGKETGMIGTLYAQPGWNSPPPKPFFKNDKIVAQFKGIEAKDGLISASLTAADKAEFGRLQRSAPGEWEFRISTKSGTPISRDEALLCAAQLIAEHAKK